MLKIGFVYSIGLCGCDSREILEFADFDRLDDLDYTGTPAREVILEYGQSEAEGVAESYGYYEEGPGVFLNDDGYEVTPEVTAYLLTTPEEEGAFTDGLDEGIGEIIS